MNIYSFNDKRYVQNSSNSFKSRISENLWNSVGRPRNLLISQNSHLKAHISNSDDKSYRLSWRDHPFSPLSTILIIKVNSFPSSQLEVTDYEGGGRGGQCDTRGSKKGWLTDKEREREEETKPFVQAVRDYNSMLYIEKCLKELKRQEGSTPKCF